MSNITVLAAEIVSDPLTRGYSGMSDDEVLADGYLEYRTRPRTLMTGSEVLNAVDLSELNDLTELQQSRMYSLLAMGGLNPYGVEADLIVQWFGAESDTVDALAVARLENITRWADLGLSDVRVGHIQMARS